MCLQDWREWDDAQRMRSSRLALPSEATGAASVSPALTACLSLESWFGCDGILTGGPVNGHRAGRTIILSPKSIDVNAFDRVDNVVEFARLVTETAIPVDVNLDGVVGLHDLWLVVGWIGTLTVANA